MRTFCSYTSIDELLTPTNWWLRTVNAYNNGFVLVNQDGNYVTITSEKTYGIVIGFCI